MQVVFYFLYLMATRKSLNHYLSNISNKIRAAILNPSERFVTHIAVAFMLCALFVFTGGSALFTSDSGAYLLNARELKVPGDRSIFYSVFIHYTSEYIRLFHQPHVVEILLVQSLFIYSVIFVFFKNFFGNKNGWLLLIALLFFFCFTPLPWLMIQLMPDLFTCMVFFCALLFLKSNDLLSAFFLAILLIFCLIMHNSNIVLFFLFSGGTLAFRKKLDAFNFIQKRFLQMFVTSIVAILCVVGTNVYAKNRFTLASASHIFLMGKLSENGVLKKYLDKYCKTEPNALCAYKDKLPEHGWDFVWETDGAFANSGGWDHSDTLYKRIIYTTLTDPDLLSANMIAAIKATFQQIILTGSGDGMCKMDTSATLANELKIHYPYDYQRLINDSKQQKEEIDFAKFNQFYVVFQWIIIVFALILLIRNRNKQHIVLFALALYFAFCNAFVTGALANVISRLNTKGIIVLVGVSILIIVDQLSENYTHRKLENGTRSVEDSN